MPIDRVHRPRGPYILGRPLKDLSKAKHVVFVPFQRNLDVASFAEHYSTWGVPLNYEFIRYVPDATLLSSMQLSAVLSVVCKCEGAGESVSDGSADKLKAAGLAERLRDSGLKADLACLQLCALGGNGTSVIKFITALHTALEKLRLPVSTRRGFAGSLLLKLPERAERSDRTTVVQRPRREIDSFAPAQPKRRDMPELYLGMIQGRKGP
ncbi:hypothetical protein [Muricoccus radiodurans]|uniref:hypothetical protein n=1 Tax=Muricoccus radiodurans TaxID=2231721 RepID=UPI003CEB14EC